MGYGGFEMGFFWYAGYEFQKVGGKSGMRDWATPPSLKCEIWNLPTLYKLEIVLIGIIFVTYEDWKQKHCNLVHFSFSYDYLRRSFISIWFIPVNKLR